MRTNDDIHLVVPNANLISDTIVNWTYRGSEVQTLTAAGIAIPNPQRDRHIRSAPELEKLLKARGLEAGPDDGGTRAGGTETAPLAPRR